MINFLFILTAEALDVIFCALFPIDLSKLSISVVFHFTLIALILISRKSDKIDSFLSTFIVGGILGNRLNGLFFEMGFIYLFVIILVDKWFKNFNESFIESIIVVAFAIFIKEFALYLLMISNQRTAMFFLNWALRRCIPTLLGNMIPCMLMLILDDYKNRFLQKKEVIKRREESLFFKSAEARIKKK